MNPTRLISSQAESRNISLSFGMTSPHGTVLLPLKLEASMQPGYLFAPIHFSEPNFNCLMSAVPIDPKARMPALKAVPVKIQKEKCK